MDYGAFKYSARSETPDKTTTLAYTRTLQAAGICGEVGLLCSMCHWEKAIIDHIRVGILGSAR